MSRRRISGLTVIGVLLASVIHADLIPPGVTVEMWRNRRQSWIELSADHLPQGMVLLFVDAWEGVWQKVHEKEVIKITNPGDAYAAWEKDLSTPFSLKSDKAKLHQVKRIHKFEIPSAYGRFPLPSVLKCTANGNASDPFVFDCKNVSSSSKTPLDFFKK